MIILTMALWKNKHVWLTLGVVSGVLVLDQLTKWIAKTYLRPRLSIPVIGDFLRFTYVENPGMAFGIQIGNKVLFNFLSIIAVLVIFYYLFKMRDHNFLRLSFAMILGGAFGNLIDRFLYGRVVDFIDVEFFDISFKGGKFLFFELPAYEMHRWPVFNVADMAVSIGMLLIILATLFERNPEMALAQNASTEDPNIPGT